MSENLYVELSDRSKQIFKSVVETYLETGSPSGSETILKKGGVDAEFVVHPECSCTTPMMYDIASGRYKNHQVQILSTEGMMNHVSKSDSQQFVVATETGILYRMRQQNPQKTFIPASENAECEYMKMITLDKVYRSLYDEKYEVKVAKRIADKARLAIERMLSIS